MVFRTKKISDQKFRPTQHRHYYVLKGFHVKPEEILIGKHYNFQFFILGAVLATSTSLLRLDFELASFTRCS
jgi:hypothetical protein